MNEPYERSDNFFSEHSSRVGSTIPREGGDGRSHHRRVGDLHDIRCCISLLSGEECHGTDALRSAGDADLLHDLPAVEQPDHSPRSEIVGAGLQTIIPGLVAADHCARWLVPLRHGPGMAPADLRTRTHHLDQPVWDDLLLTRRLACLSRYSRSDHALAGRNIRIYRPYGSESVRSRRGALDVLAFRRCRVGCGVHRSLRSWTLRNLWQYYPRQSP